MGDQILLKDVVDTAEAVRLLGLSDRRGIHYYKSSGRLTPLCEMNGGHVYLRSDVMELLIEGYGRKSRELRHKHKKA